MKRLCLAVALGLLLAGCAARRPAAAGPSACPVGARSPLLGCWRVVESQSPQGIRPGGLMRFDEDQVSVWQDELLWVRMPVRWDDPAGPARLTGAYLSGNPVELDRKSVV